MKAHRREHLEHNECSLIAKDKMFFSVSGGVSWHPTIRVALTASVVNSLSQSWSLGCRAPSGGIEPAWGASQ